MTVKSEVVVPNERIMGPLVEGKPAVSNSPVQPHQHRRHEQLRPGITLDYFKMQTCPAGRSLRECACLTWGTWGAGPPRGQMDGHWNSWGPMPGHQFDGFGSDGGGSAGLRSDGSHHRARKGKSRPHQRTPHMQERRYDSQSNANNAVEPTMRREVEFPAERVQ